MKVLLSTLDRDKLSHRRGRRDPRRRGRRGRRGRHPRGRHPRGRHPPFGPDGVSRFAPAFSVGVLPLIRLRCDDSSGTPQNPVCPHRGAVRPPFPEYVRDRYSR
jgi:hypothetical protein